MKIQTTITISENTVPKIRERVGEGSFRNKSHFFEYAAMKFLENYEV